MLNYTYFTRVIHLIVLPVYVYAVYFYIYQNDTHAYAMQYSKTYVHIEIEAKIRLRLRLGFGPRAPKILKTALVYTRRRQVQPQRMTSYIYQGYSIAFIQGPKH